LISTSLYGDGTENNTGYLSAQQTTALDTYDDTEKLLREGVAEIVKGSSNSRIEQMVLEKSRERLRLGVQEMTKHAASERVKHQNLVGEAREAQAFDDAVKSYNDPAIMASSLKTLGEENASWAARNGASEEQASARLLGRNGVVVKGAFDAAIANEDDIAVAEAIYRQHKDKVDPGTFTHMVKQLKTEGRAKAAQDVAGKAFEMFKDDQSAGIAYIDELVDGKTQDEAMLRYRQLIGDVRADETIERLRASEARSERAEERTLAAEARPEVAQGLVESSLQSNNYGDFDARKAYIMENSSGKDQEYALKLLRDEQSDVERLKQIAHADFTRNKAQRDEQTSQKLDAAMASATQAILDGRSLNGWIKDNKEAYVTLSVGDGSTRDRMEELRKREERFVNGKRYRNTSDGETYKKLSQLPNPELAKVDVFEVESNLTEDEATLLARKVEAAQARLERKQESTKYDKRIDNALNQYGRVIFGVSAKRKTPAHINAYNEAFNDMQAWVQEQIDADVPITAEMINAEAARLSVRLTVAPDGLMNDYDSTVAQFDKLLPQDQAEANVDLDNLSEDQTNSLVNLLAQNGITDPPEKLLQSLANASYIPPTQAERKEQIIKIIKGWKAQQ